MVGLMIYHTKILKGIQRLFKGEDRVIFNNAKDIVCHEQK